MITKTQTIVRAASQDDHHSLANLVHFETSVHRHLDYRPPLDWIGSHPFMVLEQNREIIAALACPPDPETVAWIRLFAVTNFLPISETWDSLWSSAAAWLAEHSRARFAAAIPMHTWFEKLLQEKQFQLANRIVMLSWEAGQATKDPAPNGVRIRPMSLDDLPLVTRLDAGAFSPVWQNSQACLEAAFRQSAVATVAEINGEPAGYQISTATPVGGHLARLAVQPDVQGRHIGYALVKDLLRQFTRRGARSVTVNTQKENLSSLALYRRAGFQFTGEEYPFYQLEL